MIDQLQLYHTLLKQSSSSGYPNLSYFNPQHQQSPFPLGGVQNRYSNPYDRLYDPRFKLGRSVATGMSSSLRNIKPWSNPNPYRR